MADTQGTISIGIDVVAEIEKCTVDTSKLDQQIKAAASKGKKQKLDVPIEVVAQLEGAQRALGEASLKAQAIADKALKSVKVRMDIGDQIKRELQLVDNTLTSNGQVTKAKLQNFMRELLGIGNGRGWNLNPDFQAVDKQFKDLIGKRQSDAKKLLGQTISDLDKQRQSISAALSGIKAGNEFKGQTYADLVVRATKGISPEMERAQVSVKALAEAFDLLRVKGGKSTLDLPVNASAKDYQRVINQLTSGREALIKLGATLQGNSKLAAEYNLTQDQMAKKIGETELAISQVLPKLNDLKAKQKSVEKVSLAGDKLAGAKSQVETYDGKDDRLKLQLLKDQLVAARAYDRARSDGSHAETEAAKAAVESQGRIVKALDNTARQKFESLKGHIEKTQSILDATKAPHGPQSDEYIRTLQVRRDMENQYLGMLNRHKDVVSQNYLEEINQSRALIHSLDLQIKQKKENISLSERVANSQLKVGQFSAPGSDPSLYKKAVDSSARITAQKALASAHPEDIAAAQLAEAEQKRLKARTDQIKLQENLLRNLKGTYESLGNAEKANLSDPASLKRYADVLRDLEGQLKRIRKLSQNGLLDEATKAEISSLGSIYGGMVDKLSPAINAQREINRLTKAYADTSTKLDTARKLGTNDLPILKERYSLLSQIEKIRSDSASSTLRDNQAQLTAIRQLKAEAYTAYQEKAPKPQTKAPDELAGLDKPGRDLYKNLDQQLNRFRDAQSRAQNAGSEERVLGFLKQQQDALERILLYKKQINELGLAGDNRFSKFNASSAFSGAEGQLADLRAQIEVSKQVVAENARLSSSYNSLGNAFRSFIRYGVEMVAFYKAQQAITAMAKSVIDLDNALKSVQAIARATDEEMTGVAAAVKKVAIDTQFSTNEIAGAAQTLAQAGVEITKVGEALAATAQFASATGSSLATSADLMTTMANVFKDMSFNQISDQLTATINLSKLTGEELSTILSRAVEVSDTFHIMPQQMNAAFAVLRNAGIKASTISTGYRQALLELFSPDDKTLKFLQKRYAEIGQQLSKSDISAMFQGFAHSADPIRAAAQELDKLGYSTSAASEWARVYDVRATNVLNVLVKQRDEYVKLTTQIDSNGAAAKGAATQLEALGKSWDNLGSIITAVASEAFGGGVSNMKAMVDVLANLIQKAGEAINTFKRLQGEAGSMSSSIVGVFAGLGKFIGSKGGYLSALGTGMGVGSLVQIAQTASAQLTKYIGDEGAKLISGFVETVSVFLSAKYLLGKSSLGSIFSSAAERVNKVGKPIGQVTRPTGSLDSKGSPITEDVVLLGTASIMDKILAKVYDWIKNFGAKIASMGRIGAMVATPMGAVVGAALVTLGLGLTLLRKDVDQQLQAVTNDIEKAKAGVKAAQDSIANLNNDMFKQADIKGSLERVSSGTMEFFKRNATNAEITSKQVSDVLAKLSSTSKDLGGSQLAQSIEEVGKQIGVSLAGYNLDELISKVNESGAVIAKVEGIRLERQQKLMEAYQDYEKTGNKSDLLKTYQKLTAAEQASISNSVDSLEEAIRFMKDNEAFMVASTDEQYRKLRENTAARLRGDVEKVKLNIQKARDSGDITGVMDQVLQAAKDGLTDVLIAYRDQINEALAKEQVRNDELSAKLRELSGGEFRGSSGMEKRLAAKKGLSDETLKGLSKLSGNIEGQVKAVVENQAKAANDSVSDNARKKAEFEDQLLKSLPKDVADSLGLKSSTVRKKMDDVEKTVADLDDAWKDVYYQATQTGKTSREQVAYLEKQRDLNGSLPPIFNDILERSKKSSEALVGNQEAIRAAKVAYEDAAKKEAENAKEASAIPDQIKKLEGQKLEALAKGRDGQWEVNDITAQITGLERRQANLSEERIKLHEDVSRKFKDYQGYLEAVGEATRDQEQQALEMDRLLKNQVLTFTKSQQKTQDLLGERQRLLADGNAVMAQSIGIDAEISGLAQKELESRKSLLLDLASKNKGLTEKSGWFTDKSGGMTLENLTKYFMSNTGQEAVVGDKTQQVIFDHLQKLNEDIKKAKVDSATRNLETAKAAATQTAAQGLSQLETEKAAKQNSLDTTVSYDPAKRDSDLTRLVLENAAKRMQIIKDEVAAKAKAYEDEFKAAKAYGISDDQAQKQLYSSKLALMREYLDARKAHLNELYGEEKKHTDAIKALDEDLRNSQLSDLKFRRDLLKEFMDESDKREFDRVNAVRDATKAIEDIRNGDYEHGRKLLDEAISAQQSYIRETAAAEKKGEVTLGSTQAAMVALANMEAERNKAILDQRKLHEESEAASLKAIQDEKAAIESLNATITNLTDTLSKAPPIELKISSDNATPVIEGVKSALDGIQDKTVTITARVVTEGSAVVEGSPGKQGLLSGPGTGTSDSIPIAASAGEYIVPAETVKRVGVGFLDALRSGKSLLTYAKGGLVSGLKRIQKVKDKDGNTRYERAGSDTADGDSVSQLGAGRIKGGFGTFQDGAFSQRGRPDGITPYSGTPMVLPSYSTGRDQAADEQKAKEQADKETKANEEAQRQRDVELQQAANAAIAQAAQDSYEKTKALQEETNAKLAANKESQAKWAASVYGQSDGNSKVGSLRSAFDQALKLPGASDGKGPEFQGPLALGGVPLSALQTQASGLLKGIDIGNIDRKESSGAQQKHLIEIKSVDTGQSATVSSDQKNVGELLSVLKTIKGVSF